MSVSLFFLSFLSFIFIETERSFVRILEFLDIKNRPFGTVRESKNPLFSKKKGRSGAENGRMLLETAKRWLIFLLFYLFCIDFRKMGRCLSFFLFRREKRRTIFAFFYLLHDREKSAAQQTIFCCTAKYVLLPNRKEYAAGIFASVGRINCF